MSRTLGCALALVLWASACAAPPRGHALIVRDAASKCALVRFAGCAALLDDVEEDAGSD